MYPPMIATIADVHIREQRERAARARTARGIRRQARPRDARPVHTTGWARGPVTLARALNRAKA